MGNRAFVYLFLIIALSFLFTAVSAAVLAVRRTKSLRISGMAWAALFVSAALPILTGNSVIDLFLYGDWSGGLRVVIFCGMNRLGEFSLSCTAVDFLRNTASLLTLLWLTAGSASLAYRMSSYFNNVHFLTKRSRVCRDMRANTVFDGAAAKAGVRGHVPLRVMDPGLKLSPCTCGILSPCVFVGEDYLRDYDDTRLELIFLHELTHVRRHDTLLKLLTLAVTSMHVFLPTSARICRAVKEDSELLCDLDVLRNVGSGMRGEYIAVIIDAAERSIKERQGDLLSSVSSQGAFILRRYRNMQEAKPQNVPKSLSPIVLSALAVNILLMCTLGIANLANPGVDIEDELTREALCAYFMLDDAEDLTEMHMASVYSVAYTLADHRDVLGDDHPMRFTRQCIINEGLRPDTESPYAGEESLIYVGAYSILPAYLSDEMTDGDTAAYLAAAAEKEENAVFGMRDRILDLRDLSLFTGLRTLTLSGLLTPFGFDPGAETGFAVIYQ